MATFVDPVADAAEAYEGLRGLAHATRTFEDPADTYRVLGEGSGSVRLLRQVLDQLSRAHADHRDIAFTDDRAPAEAVALAAADELHQTADGLEEVADRVMREHEASGRIAWHTHTNPEPERSRRWVNVVFLQSSEADEVLDLIDLEGVQAGIAHLAQLRGRRVCVDLQPSDGVYRAGPRAPRHHAHARRGRRCCTGHSQWGHVRVSASSS